MELSDIVVDSETLIARFPYAIVDVQVSPDPSRTQPSQFELPCCERLLLLDNSLLHTLFAHLPSPLPRVWHPTFTSFERLDSLLP